MLEMGQSKPWPDALYALTGERQMDATAILEYFAPLKAWLDEQNKGQKMGFWPRWFAPVLRRAASAASSSGIWRPSGD
jgi:Angiotensin-converting enzyme